MKNIGVCLHHNNVNLPRHSRGSLGSAPVSYVLELTGLHQGIFNVLYSYVQKECKFTNVQYS